MGGKQADGCRITTFTGMGDVLAAKTSDHLPVLARFRTDGRLRDRR
jgi:hypothetical protein